MPVGSAGSRFWNHLIFIGPAVLFFSLIVVIPFLLGISYSMTSWDGVSATKTWIGFDNFAALLWNDPQFLNSFWFTIRFTVTSIVIGNVLGFFLALMLSQGLKSRNLLRVAFFLPNVLAGLLLGFIWQFIFIKGFPSIGKMTGIPLFNQSWLGDSSTAFWGMVIVFVWQVSGYLMVIYIAAINNIDSSLLEAAKIDGANSLGILRHIILPLVVPALTICLFLSLSMAFKVFDMNLAMTYGGPFNSTQSVALNIYFEAFQNSRYGLGSAKALVFFVIVALITVLQVRVTKKREVQM